MEIFLSFSDLFSFKNNAQILNVAGILQEAGDADSRARTRSQV